MIKGTPFKCFLEKNEYDYDFVTQATGLNVETLRNLIKGKSFSPKTISTICKTFKIQPCDVIEWDEKAEKGHWVFVAEGENANS